jgi:hypothetical protein
VKFKDIRIHALSMPSVTEEPHFDYSSFRVRGKIFMTVPPDKLNAHIFVSELDRERALIMYPEFVENLFWGKKILGLRVNLAKAKPPIVKDLIRQAWGNKAPRRLAAAVGKESIP